MSANTELFDGKYTIADLRAMIADGQIARASETYKSAMAFMELRAAEEAKMAEARAHRNAVASARVQSWTIWIAAIALFVSFGALGLAVVALSESHIHVPAKP